MEPSLKDTILKFSLRFREVKIKGTLGDALLYPGTGFGGKYLGTTVQNSSRVSFQDCFPFRVNEGVQELCQAEEQENPGLLCSTLSTAAF